MPFVTSAELFRKAYEGGYAIGAFNVYNMELIQAVTETAEELKSPVILAFGKSAIQYAHSAYVKRMAEAALAETSVPVVLHLDHGADFQICKDCIDSGFSSVMIDGSFLPFEENIAKTREVVEYAHERGVVVEAELGALAGDEDDVSGSEQQAAYTRPEQVEEFAARTGCDSLAIAIGTSHGAYKFKPGTKPELRFDILEEVGRRLPGFPIVLHGASSVPPALIRTINELGGDIPDAVGIPEELLRKACSMAVCKINVNTDLKMAMTAAIRKCLHGKPSGYDPAEYLKAGKEAVKETVAHKMRAILGSEGKA